MTRLARVALRTASIGKAGDKHATSVAASIEREMGEAEAIAAIPSHAYPTDVLGYRRNYEGKRIAITVADACRWRDHAEMRARAAARRKAG